MVLVAGGWESSQPAATCSPGSTILPAEVRAVRAGLRVDAAEKKGFRNWGVCVCPRTNVHRRTLDVDVFLSHFHFKTVSLSLYLELIDSASQQALEIRRFQCFSFATSGVTSACALQSTFM